MAVERITETLQRQATILGETEQYLRRDFGKYAKGAVGMWYVFGSDFETGDGFRSTYYLFRNIDDILDGDREVAEDPVLYAKAVQSHISERKFDPSKYPIDRLAKRSLEYLDRVKRPGDDPESEVLQLIDAMTFDRYRMQNRLVLSQKELLSEYKRQFEPIINLQCIGLESDIRVTDIPDFPIVQARVYSLIDMESDWNKGLINVPAEVLLAAGLDADVSFETVRTSPVIQQWMVDECIDCGERLEIDNEILSDRLSQPKDKVAGVIFENLTDKIVKHISVTLDTDNNTEKEHAPNEKMVDKLLPTLAIGEALKLSMQYARDLQIEPSEIFRYLKKSSSLAGCYAGFALDGSRVEAIGAGKAAFLSCAYDVVSDWNKPDSTRMVFQTILKKEVSAELASMAVNLLERDLKGDLHTDGLERGVISTHFVLESMGVKNAYERKTDVDKMGRVLQIVDDILDYEDDVESGDTNCLTSFQYRFMYLSEFMTLFNEQNLKELFPHAGVLGIAIEKAREKAIDMFRSPRRYFQ